MMWGKHANDPAHFEGQVGVIVKSSWSSSLGSKVTS